MFVKFGENRVETKKINNLGL